MVIKIRNVVIVCLAAVVIFFAAFKLGDIDLAEDFSGKTNKTEKNVSVNKTENGEGEEAVEDDVPAHKHAYESASGNTCTVCGQVYEPVIKEAAGTYTILTKNCAVRSFYYQGDNIVKRMNVGDEVKVVGLLTNALKHDWYITEEGNYIYAENLAAVSEE